MVIHYITERKGDDLFTPLTHIIIPRNIKSLPHPTFAPPISFFRYMLATPTRSPNWRCQPRTPWPVNSKPSLYLWNENTWHMHPSSNKFSLTA